MKHVEVLPLTYTCRYSTYDNLTGDGGTQEGRSERGKRRAAGHMIKAER